ncbi:molecular chaperone DnaJ, partial [Corallococcus sicarius]
VLAGATPPLRLGPARASEDDLWRIVSFDESNDPSQNLTASFEAALQQVDAHLEALVRSDVGSAGEANEFLVEAIVEATFEPLPSPRFAAFPGDNGGASGQTDESELSGELDDWDFDEDDVAAEDPSNPDEASKLRRQRLLRRAMENMGALGGRPLPPTCLL